MPLPIVLGGTCLSAERLHGPFGRPDETDDGRMLIPFNLYQNLSWGVCPKGEWLVRVTCSYYDLLDPENGKRDCTMVEVRIQISPMTRPLSSDYRETSHHLKLVDGAPGDYAHSQTQVEVSWDRRNLAVLIFHPHQQSSACVIFQLHKARLDHYIATESTNSSNPIPLPSYIQDLDPRLTSRDPPAVATHPRFVNIREISTICRLPNVHPSMYMVARQDGTIVRVDARSSRAVAMGSLKEIIPEPQMLPFSRMTAAPSPSVYHGRLAMVTANGKSIVMKWQLKASKRMRTSLSTSELEASLDRKVFHSNRERDRRRSALPKQGLNENAALDTLLRNMSFEVLATLGPTSNEGTGPTQQGPGESTATARGSGKKARGQEDRGCVVDAKFSVVSSIVCLLYAPSDSNRTVAEIFSISETGSMEAMLPLCLGREQIEHAFNMHPARGGGEEVASTIPFTTSLQSRFGLDYDALSDTFAISTTYSGSDRWVGCLWNWRSNVLGWTIQHASSSSSLWSRLYFARHQLHGNHLVFLESQVKEKYLYSRKHGVAIGLLSPSSSHDGPCLEPNSLLLSSDSVRFADVYQRSGSDLLELEWKIATLPLNYRNAYGPPSIATSGRQNGSCIAVASMNGLCILDRFYKWKQFGTPSEEKSFQVLAMTWWEGLSSTDARWQQGAEAEELSQDLLVAIIQSNNGRQYLSCWSPKRLDLAHQLLETPDYKPVRLDDGSVQWSWGIPLVKDVKLTSISLLAEPLDANTNNPRRAVVMVSSSNAETCEMNYSCYCLQVSNRSSATQADTYHELKPYVVLAQESISGVLKNAVSPISFAFLAAANFDFELCGGGGQSQSEGTAFATSQEIVITLGVVRSLGGIDAIALSADNRAFFASIIKRDEVSKVGLADVVCNSSSCDVLKDDEQAVDSFVWTIELLNGRIYCWNVPYRIVGDVDELQLSLLPKRDGRIHRPDGLNLPAIICKKESRETRHRYFLGTSCHIGSSTDWMQQSSSGTQTDVSLGLVPESEFGCVLRAGQHVRRLHRSGDGSDFDPDLFASDFLESEVYGPSEFLMMPPVFVSSVYMLLLEAAYLQLEVPLEGEEIASEQRGAKQRRLKTIGNHISRRLHSNRNSDAVMMALRLLILRAVELLSGVDKKHRKAGSVDSKSNLMLAMSLFSEIVDVVRRCTSDLQFAAFFLEVGRQIEPSCLAHLFPLPQSRDIPPEEGNHPHRRSVLIVDEVDRFTARSVVDLFSLCIHEGSLAASASALPLLDSRIQSRNYCDLLLMRAIASFVRNADSREAEFDCTQEERRVIGDIFHFGIKLEDAALFEKQMTPEESKAEVLSEGGRLLPEDTKPPVVFDSASSDESDDLNIQSDHKCFVRRGNQSVAGLVGDALLDLLRTPKIDRPWQAMAALARLLLQNSNRMPEIDVYGSAVLTTDRALLEDILPARHCRNDAGDEDDDGNAEPIVRFLINEMYCCGKQIQYAEAAFIVDLVLVLLERMEDFPLPSEQHFEVTAGLVLIGLVAGHHSGRAEDLLLTARDDSCILPIYRDAREVVVFSATEDSVFESVLYPRSHWSLLAPERAVTMIEDSAGGEEEYQDDQSDSSSRLIWSIFGSDEEDHF